MSRKTDTKRRQLDRKLKNMVNAAVWETMKTQGLGGLHSAEINRNLGALELRPMSDGELKRNVMRAQQSGQLGGWWDIASSIGSTVASGAGSAWDAVSGAASGAYDYIRSGIGDAAATAADWGGSAWDTASGWFGDGGDSQGQAELDTIEVTGERPPTTPNSPGSAPVNTSTVPTPEETSIMDSILGDKGIEMVSDAAKGLAEGYMQLEKMDAKEQALETQSEIARAQGQGGQQGPYPVPVPGGGGSGSARPSPGGRPIGTGGGGGGSSGGGLPLPLLLAGGALAFFLLTGDDNGKGRKAGKGKGNGK